jgi:flagellar basal-body rod protein FlgG
MSGVFRSSVTGLQAQQTRLDMIANNIANLYTPGFRGARADLAATPRQPLAVADANGTLELGGGVELTGTTRVFAQGALQLTSGTLDLAILGADGFFQIALPGGGTAFTRAGGFSLDGEGYLVAGNGDRLAPPIQVPAGMTISHINGDGTVYASRPGSPTREQVGQLTLARFPNPDGLAAVGADRFVATDAAGALEPGAPGSAGFPEIGSGVLEASNVDMAEQTTLMLDAQRAYSMNLRAVQALDEMIGLVVQMRS